MSQSQEIITPDLAKKIQAYESLVRTWRSKKATDRRGALYAATLAAPLWIVSYLASAETGPINQSTWFTALTFFAFVGALGASICAIIFGGILAVEGKPVRDFLMENEVR